MNTSEQLTVTLINNEGIALPISNFPHRLRCEHPGACTFNKCLCGPAVSSVMVRPSYERQLEAVLGSQR